MVSAASGEVGLATISDYSPRCAVVRWPDRRRL